MAAQQSPSSLKRLQELDSAYSSYHEQLQALIQILDLGEQSANDLGGHSRSQYAVKWLTKNLLPQTSEGSQARTNPQSWATLKGLLASMPMAVTADVLGKNVLLDTISSAMQDLLSLGARQLHEDSLKDNSSGSRRCFENVLDLLGTLIGMSDEQSGNAAAQNPQSTIYMSLRSSSEVIMTLVGRCHFVTSFVHRGEHDQALVEQVVPCMSWLLDHRIPAEGTAETQLFSKHALAGTLQLYHQTIVTGPKQTKQKIKSSSTPLREIDDLDRMLTRYLLLPLRIGSKQPAQASNDQSVAFIAYLEPLSDLVMPPLLKIRDDILVDSLARIFTLACRVVPLATPRQRLAEVPWLEVLFFNMLMFLYPHRKSPDATVTPREQLVKHVGNACRTKKLRFQTEAWRQIIEMTLRSMRNHPIDAIPIVSIEAIGAALLNDVDIALPIDEVQASGKSASILEKLLDLLAKDGWRLKTQPKSYDTKLTRSMVKFILRPIIDAHVSSRSLPSFYTLWFSQLQNVCQRSEENDELLSVWQEPSVYEFLSQKARAALSTQQVKSLVETYFEILKSSTSAKRAAASITLLGLLSKLTDLTLLKPLETLLLDLTHTCKSALFERQRSSSQWWFQWRLLSTALSHWLGLVPDPLSALGLGNNATQADFLTKLGLDRLGSILAEKMTAFEADRKEVAEALKAYGHIQRAIDSRFVQVSTKTDNERRIAEAISQALRSELSETDCTLATSLGLASETLPTILNQDTSNAHTAVQEYFKLLIKQFESDSHVNMSVNNHEGHNQEGIVRRATRLVSVIGGINPNMRTSIATAVSDAVSEKQDGPFGWWMTTLLCDEAFNTESRSKMLRATLTIGLPEQDLEGAPVRSLAEARLYTLCRFASDEKAVSKLDLHTDLITKLWTFAFWLDDTTHTRPLTLQAIVPLFEKAMRMIVAKQYIDLESLSEVTSKHWSLMKPRKGKFRASTSTDTLPLCSRPLVLVLIRTVLGKTSGPNSSLRVSVEETCTSIFCNDLDPMKSDRSHVREDNVLQLVWIISTFQSDSLRQQCAAKLLQRLEEADGTEHKIIPIARARLRLLASKSEHAHTRDISSVIGFLESEEQTLHAQTQAMNCLDLLLSGLPQEACTVNIHAFLISAAAEINHSKQPKTSHLRLFHMIITKRHDWSKDLDVSPIIAHLSQHIACAPSFEHLKLAYSSIIILLRSKDARPSQHAIESLLSSSTTLLSPSSPSFPPTSARHIFTLITTALQSLLSAPLTRKHLRGRMHLLLPLLTGLVALLFASPPHPPPWHLRTSPLQPRDAQRLSRILSAVADPVAGSLSAQSRRKGSKSTANASLADESAKARTHAARFAPLLLSDLAGLMLRSAWAAPGVRDAILPGIWSVLGGLARVKGGLDVLSAGLGSGAREVMRGLISEWRRVGAAS